MDKDTLVKLLIDLTSTKSPKKQFEITTNLIYDGVLDKPDLEALMKARDHFNEVSNLLTQNGKLYASKRYDTKSLTAKTKFYNTAALLPAKNGNVFDCSMCGGKCSPTIRLSQKTPNEWINWCIACFPEDRFDEIRSSALFETFLLIRKNTLPPIRTR